MSPTSATNAPKRRVAHPSDGSPKRSGANLAWVISHSMQESEEYEDFVCPPANLPLHGVPGRSPGRVKELREGSGIREGPGLIPRPFSLRPLKCSRFSLGVVGPYLAVDLLDKSLAILMVLLELANLLKLLGGKAFDPPGNLRDTQLVVVRSPERAHNGGP
jgi:hypothetical protein